MKTIEIRNKFVDFFVKNGHRVVLSSSLVPEGDQSLLFTNAGMVQFKNVFLGKETLPHTRAVTVQRCMRAGGKHNDLENVGYTKRHHTYFEMLGNFSFGDYFKREAIKYAWEFLTGKEWMGLAPEKLWVTVHHNDKDAADIWLKEVKIDPKKFSTCGDKDNFWAMGDTGPCGFCSEIYYDYGQEYFGDAPSDHAGEGERYVEIWNLVFMEFERDEKGNLKKLARPCIDTGMGLERIAAVMQEQETLGDNYNIDIFRELRRKLMQCWNITDEELAKNKNLNISLKVIMDHSRAIVFLLVDGVKISNEGRGYVLRRIVRRALRHLKKLRSQGASLCDVIDPLVDVFGEFHPDLLPGQQKWLKGNIEAEEKLFGETLGRGMEIFEQEIKDLQTKTIPGQVVFKLYDTYGFPPDLTADIARERGFGIDSEGFEKEMAKQRQLSQTKSKFVDDYAAILDIDGGMTEFVGYDKLATEAKVVALFNKDGSKTDKLKSGACGIVVLDKTSFYAEAGGQIGDVGEITCGTSANFTVENTKKQGGVYLHYGRVVGGGLSMNMKVEAAVSALTRHATAANHSATHLLQKALRQILGDHVDIAQKGSYVDAHRLRFDFTYFEPINDLQLADVERLVNQQIQAGLPVKTEVLNIDDAKKQGAIALFDEKYGKMVRVVSMSDFSKELCGGTHVDNTGKIGFFKIISESGIAAGVRRIEAVTAQNALELVNCNERQLQQVHAFLRTDREKVVEKVQQLVEKAAAQEKEIQKLRSKLISFASDDLTKQAVMINGVKVLVLKLEDMDAKALRENLDQLKAKLETSVIVLASVKDEKAQVIAGVTKNCTPKISANDLIKHITAQIDGSGGGRPDMAQGGGANSAALGAALKSVRELIERQLMLPIH